MGLNENDTSHWSLDTPDGEIIIGAASGSNSWYTNVANQGDIENSQVVSPCFDLSGLEKPMIKMNIWSSSVFKRDGAVMQYSTDYGNEWKNLGNVGEGIDWFNSEDIQSQPGSSDSLKNYVGWNTIPMPNWTSARHNLEILKGSTNVKFRVAYATDGVAFDKVDGFAFDDVWIGDRQQNVLTEHFTNATVPASLEGDEYLADFEKNKSADLIPIHYHTSSPAGDVIYDDYEEGPASRVFYYGVSHTPNVFANGSINSSLSDSISKIEFENSNDVETLKDPDISLNIKLTQSNVDVSIAALSDLSDKNLVLYVAIVKDSVKVENVYFYNVLRMFLPSPGGISLSTEGFTAGQTLNELIPLDLSNSSEFIGSNLVVFVQNSISKKVYQAESLKLTGSSTAIQTEIIGNLVDIYPNPAIDYLFIDSEYEIDRLLIIDISGRIINEIEPDQKRLSIPISDYKYGLYFIKGTTQQGEFVKKFIKQ
jgi:hypothetical protein